MTRPSAFLTHRLCQMLTALFFCLLLQTGCSTDLATSAALPLAAAATIDGSSPSYQLVSGDLSETSASSAVIDAPLKLLGRGTEARIVNLEGDVLKTGETGRAIYGLQISPDQSMALIYYGSAKYTVSRSDNLDSKLDLPVAPPASSGATGFVWRWLDANHLVGNADIPSTDTEGKTAAEIEGLPPRQSLLYVYGLEKGTLTPVQIDAALPQAFMVYQTSGWNITLLTHDDELVGARVEQVPDP